MERRWVLSAIGIFVLAISDWLGGTLVYRNQIAVDHRYANASNFREVTLTRWDQSVCKAEDLADGQMLLADISGTRIAVGRCGDDFVAFSDSCTHTGGPLSDGALVACTVRCPWHGSQFNVRTGAVMNGPANNPIEIFDVEVREDQIYIRTRKGEEKRAA
jgi:nitrite reductase/ring-hydroxylating ferredoxin subunit